jgi:hypothetical protein
MKRLVTAALFAGFCVQIVSPAGATEKHPTAEEQNLMRRADLFDERCRAPGQNANGRVCTARNSLFGRLERMGWCWGSEYQDSVEADYHWLRCSRQFKIQSQPPRG